MKLSQENVRNQRLFLLLAVIVAIGTMLYIWRKWESVDPRLRLNRQAVDSILDREFDFIYEKTDPEQWKMTGIQKANYHRYAKQVFDQLTKQAKSISVDPHHLDAPGNMCFTQINYDLGEIVLKIPVTTQLIGEKAYIVDSSTLIRYATSLKYLTEHRDRLKESKHLQEEKRIQRMAVMLGVIENQKAYLQNGITGTVVGMHTPQLYNWDEVINGAWAVFKEFGMAKSEIEKITRDTTGIDYAFADEPFVITLSGRNVNRNP